MYAGSSESTCNSLLDFEIIYKGLLLKEKSYNIFKYTYSKSGNEHPVDESLNCNASLVSSYISYDN